jgi:putative DNA primase/helicase
MKRKNVFDARAATALGIEPGNYSQTPINGKAPASVADEVANQTEDRQQSQKRECLKRAGGIYVRCKNDQTGKFEEKKLCGPVNVFARIRDSCDQDWSILVEWESASGQKHREPFQMSQFAMDDRHIVARLMDGGLWIAPGSANRRLVVNYLQTAAIQEQELWQCVSRTGWHGDCFVLPDTVVGGENTRLILKTTAEQADFYRVRGTLDQWRDKVSVTV